MAVWFLLTVSVGLLAIWWLLFTRRPVGHGPKAGRVRRPAQELLDDPSLVTYDVKDINVPSLSGKLFSFFVWLHYTRFGQLFLIPVLMKGVQLFRFRGEYIPETPVMSFRSLYPPPHEEDCTQENKQLIQRLLDETEEEREGGEEGKDGGSFRFPSVLDYYSVYKSERCTPVEVADAILEAVKKTNTMTPPLRAVVDFHEGSVRKMAEASAERWKEGKPLSVLDGVPVSIKAEFRTEPYFFRCGSLFEPIFAEKTQEAHLVKNFKEAGAIIIGLTNMQEFGTGVLGSNPNRFNLTARNPYNTGCFAGGSSSGSAVSVAAGLCPISLGADAGGSVRIPAALCGLFGLKPTHGLLDSSGGMPLTSSICSPGPLCASALDAIVAMDTLARTSQGPKLLPLRGIGARTLGGLKVGVYREYFDHCDESVRKICESSLQVLEGLGAVVVEVKIPEVEEMRIAHVISTMSEFSTGLACDVDKHFDLLNSETSIFLAPAFQVTATDYLNAQKQRARVVVFLKKIFENVDVIVTPMIGCVAPKIDPDGISHGKLMATESSKLIRFAGLANFAGNPAITCPIGISSGEGLPVGLQFIGKWFDETTLLSIAWVMEKSDQFPTTRPSVFCDILKYASKKD